MRNRKQDTLYIYNDYVRAGFNRSYGGALFELYGTDKVNRIEEHGGSALQLSLWGYGYSATPRRWLYYTTQRCDTTAYSSHEQCRQNNRNSDCRRFPESGSHISDCVTERFCDTWTAGGPWNPIQARADNCTWNGHGNDVTQVTQRNRHSISLRKIAPYNYTKTSAYHGMEWTVTGSTKNNVPYLELTYAIRNHGEATVAHNQEIPAIFLDRILPRSANSTGLWEYSFYTGAAGYRDFNSRITHTTYTNQKADLQLPDRSSGSSQLPLPRPSKTFRATEDWLSVCNNQDQCVTVASFSPWIRTFSMNKYYMTAMGRFAYGPHFDDAIKLYLFPYRYDDVINGKTVRQWIYELKSQHG
jgi:hypothetical protein